jgi:FlaA1/EpsC-like NDP-sugar epimerase
MGIGNTRGKSPRCSSGDCPENPLRAATVIRPRLEARPFEAIENKVFGTETVALAASGREVMRLVVGLRPGERLSEALVQEQEELLPTGHDKVLMVQNHQFDGEGFRRDLERLRGLVAARDREGAVQQLKAMAGRY